MVQLVCVLQLDQFVAPRDVTAEQPSVRDMSGVVFGVVQSDHEPLSPKLCQSGSSSGMSIEESIT